MLSRFPLEILEYILHKLSLKTLVLCTSVCKQWKSIIADPVFISNHIGHTCLLRQWRKIGEEFQFQESYSLLLDNNRFDLVTTFEYPLSDRCNHPTFSQLVGTCNGLVCLYNLGLDFIIWNPTIRKYFLLPVRRLANLSYYGFGFDSRNNDFKVVGLAGNPGYEVAVFSLATRCWKIFTGSRIPSFMLKELLFEKGNSMFKDGLLHWAVMTNKTHENFVLTFDLAEETFGEIMLPECLRARENIVSVLGGGNLLTVIHSASSAYTMYKEDFHIWIMKEYGIVESWTKVYTGFARKLSKPLGFSKRGEVLLHCQRTGKIIAVDEGKKPRKDVEIIVNGEYASLSYHIESLFLLDKSTRDGDIISY
ncbi:hypothetical protein L6164_006493 [Bauhinia variegata]|uniref:Uncharacterized protein n=1 Tax=Bauhinia variegata TaxID=167791 RepID=A0ACB9Q018_BAUVA|nr:hypothetical protein L6164_006493 [Bauhinia variegata]